MNKCLLLWFTFACALLGFATHAFPADVQSQFESMAKESPYFDWHLNKDVRTDDQQITSSYQTLLTHFRALKADKKDVLPLLKHADPKVRTLAIVYLSTLHDVQVLPSIADLLADDGVTFTGPGTVNPSGVGPLRKDISVSEIANNALAPYLNRTEYPNPYLGKLNAPPTFPPMSRQDFDTYWSKHKDRGYYASWFAARAQQISLLHLDDQVGALLRADIEKIPQPERTWLCVWLNQNAETARYAKLYKDDDLIKLLKEVGPDAILETIKKNKIPSDDPDLADTDNYKLTRDFILGNAAKIFRPQDGDTLLALNDPKDSSPWWYIAAAQLKPDKTTEILHSAYSKFPDPEQQDQLNLALWKSGDKTQIPFLVDQFFGGSTHFVGTICADDKLAGQKLISTILQDQRLNGRKWTTADLSAFVQACNRWGNKVIATQPEVEDATKIELIKFGLGDTSNQHLQEVILKKMRDSIPLWAEPKS